MESAQTLLIIDDDAALAFGLAAALECDGRRIVVCREIESAQLVVERESVTDILTDVKLTGRFRFEGLDFVDFAKRHRPDARVVLMSGDSAEGLSVEAKKRGAVAFLSKPFDVADIERLLPIPPSGSGTSVVSVPTLSEIIRDGEIVPHFQPVVALGDGSIHGYESLARLRTPSMLASPDVLFSYAERKHQLLELETACIAAAVQHGRRFGQSSRLFVNIHPRCFDEASRIHDTLVEACRRWTVPLDAIVLEITEQGALSRGKRTLSAFDELRLDGIRFAFDDVGVAYSHLPLIEQVRPSYLKISQAFGTGFETDSVRTRLVQNIVSLARDFSCSVVLEGVESVQTADAARDLGIAYAQGYFFGRPCVADRYALAG